MAIISKTISSSTQKRKRKRNSSRKIGFRLFLCLVFVPIFIALLHGVCLVVYHEAELPNQQRKSDITSIQQTKQVAVQQQKQKQQQKNLFHFIISSDCTTYQQWETLTLLHSAESIAQCGRFTWIVSGCLPEDNEQDGKGKGGANSDILTPRLIQQELLKHFPHQRVSTDGEAATTKDCTGIMIPQVHFTPDYSDMSVYGGPFADGKRKRKFVNRQGKELNGNFGNKYVFNNKPNGLLHWIQQYQYQSNDDNNEAIVLIDPDFLFLAPFTLPDNLVVMPNHPAGAKYGLGGQWLDFNRTEICGVGSPCTKATSQDVNKYYSTGPPYIVHIQDVLPLATKWAALVPPTYDYYPLLYAEMFAYSMAAAHLGLKHTLVSGLFTGCMVDWPKNKDEKEKQLVYQSAKRYADSLASSLEQKTSPRQEEPCLDPAIVPPPFLHYCRRYSFAIPFPDTAPSRSHTEIKAPFRFFAKRRVDHDVLLNNNCTGRREQNEIFVPFEATEDGKSDGDMSWNAIAVCTLTRAINNAKRRDCVQ